MTIYLIQPVKDAPPFEVGQQLLVMDLFPRNVRLVEVRAVGQYQACGYAENDCADGIRADGVKRLRVAKVGPISGCAQAVNAEG